MKHEEVAMKPEASPAPPQRDSILEASLLNKTIPSPTPWNPATFRPPLHWHWSVIKGLFLVALLVGLDWHFCQGQILRRLIALVG